MAGRPQKLWSWATLMACALVLSACGLPRAGPSTGEIIEANAEEGGFANILLVNAGIAERSFQPIGLGFSEAFLTAPPRQTDVIGPGDRVTITVWENVDRGLLVRPGEKFAIINEIQVDQRGQIFFPYAGELQASGRTPDQLRDLITSRLDIQTPDPQVEVRRAAGDASSVSVIGGVSAQGVYPIEPATRTLTSMLARAGGVTVDPDVAQIAIRRGNAVGRIFLQDLFDHPSNDVALRANDKIIVEEDRRTFTALGSVGRQSRIPFPRGEITVVDALGEVGGLDGTTSDPTGLFIFRREDGHVANRVLGRRDMPEGAPFVYVIDLTQPDGFFLAKSFQVRDNDTIYVTEAPFVAWAKILNATSQSLNFASSLVRTVEILDGD